MLFLSCNQRSNKKLTYDISCSSDKGQTLLDVYKITKPVSFKDINLNAQLKFCSNIKWKLGLDSWLDSVHFDDSWKWFHRASCGRSASASHQINAFIVSLAVADFCVGVFVVPSLFVCDIRGGCNWPRPCASWVDFLRWLFAYASIMNLCSLVLDRYMAVVKPLKYVNFMTARRVTQITLISWVFPLCLVICSVFMSLYLTSSIRVIVLAVCCAILDIFSSCMLIFCFISMVTIIYKQTRSSAILAKQLRFNHRGLTFNTYDKSAVAMLAVVVAFALACFASYLLCDFLQLLGKHKTQDFSSKSDFKFRIPMLVLNSAINPLAYAFFKRDIKRALKGK